MSEEFPAILAESPVVASTFDQLGDVLRAAREDLGLTIEEAARKLCLSPRQLTALESEEFTALPSPAFTRGFIRNYARLLNLDAAPLLECYREALPQGAGESVISLQTEGIPIQIKDKKPWISYLIASVLIGIGGGAWMAYMEWSERQAAPVVATGVVAKPVTSSPSAAPAPMPAPQPVTAVEPTPLLPPSTATESLNNPASIPMPVAAKGRLSMIFTQQSWVRVADRDGVEIFSKTKPAASEDVVEGHPPFKVDVGNAAGVQLSYNGQPVDLAPHTKANVARLTLE
jgi:cytoskeleton protein RodZ